MFSILHMEAHIFSDGCIWNAHYEDDKVAEPNRNMTMWLATVIVYTPWPPSTAHPRIWGTLDNLSALKRPLDWKILKECLKRSGGFSSTLTHSFTWTLPALGLDSCACTIGPRISNGEEDYR